MAKHARLGPSGAYIWTECTASPGESDGKPNDGNDASRMGTACHGVVAECLEFNRDPHDYFGRKFEFWQSIFGDRYEDLPENLDPEKCKEPWAVRQHVVEISSDMVDWCVAYVNFVRDLATSTGARVLVEQRVPIHHITGEDQAGGTSDVILMYGDTLHIVDGKFGRIKVTAYDIVKPSLPHPITGEMQPPVMAPNKQMAMYAAGSLHEHGLFGNFTNVKMTIVQPPLNNVSEYTTTVDALNEFTAWVKQRAEETRTNPQFKPGDHCTYCKGRVTCKPRDNHLAGSVLEGFVDVTNPVQLANARMVRPDVTLLGVYYELLPQLKKWGDDIEARMRDELRRGRRVIGPSGEAYKLVQGKNGDRKWDDPAAVERLLKEQMRLRNDQMYQWKLLSPTQVEDALVKVPKAKKGEVKKEPVLGERQWNTLKERVKQDPGGPTIALDSDPRPALPTVTDGFGDTQVSQPAAAEPVDLFN